MSSHESDTSPEAEAARAEMLQTLLRRGITDPALLRAFEAIPRHLFVPEAHRHEAYRDGPLPIDCRQTISQPFMTAIMLEQAAIRSDQRVLEVGTGSGYQTALLAEMAEQVFSIERLSALADRAREILDRLGYENVSIKVGDGTLGWPTEAPFDSIIVSAGGTSQVPEPLLEQLKTGGLLVIPLQSRGSQILNVLRRSETGIEVRPLDSCSFVPLIGRHGWPEE